MSNKKRKSSCDCSCRCHCFRNNFNTLNNNEYCSCNCNCNPSYYGNQSMLNCICQSPILLVLLVVILYSGRR